MAQEVKVSDYRYDLPQELIAQVPLEDRTASRLMVLQGMNAIEHRHFFEIDQYLQAGDVLVVNESAVIPARLHGVRETTGAHIEVLLLKRITESAWETLVRPGRRVKTEEWITFGNGLLRGKVVSVTEAGGRVIDFSYEGDFFALLDKLGEMPLPPYIHKQLHDGSRYQTVYAKERGSAAAPTAGLHFTPELLDKLREKGVQIHRVLLHVGLGTFRPVQAADIRDHVMHSEYYELPQETADAVNLAKTQGRRVIAVGTTSVRTLETAGEQGMPIQGCTGWTQLFLYPGKEFHVIDGMITNFHLPESTLLMLVSAFMGREKILYAYRLAVEKEYRFFSFGDAMLLIR